MGDQRTLKVRRDLRWRGARSVTVQIVVCGACIGSVFFRKLETFICVGSIFIQADGF